MKATGGTPVVCNHVATVSCPAVHSSLQYLPGSLLLHHTGSCQRLQTKQWKEWASFAHRDISSKLVWARLPVQNCDMSLLVYYGFEVQEVSWHAAAGNALAPKVVSSQFCRDAKSTTFSEASTAVGQHLLLLQSLCKSRLDA